MAFTQVLLLQLLLASLASASHYMGLSSTYTYRGRHPNGTFKVDFQFRDVHERCSGQVSWSCYRGQCGSSVKSQRVIIHHSPDVWCQAETLSTRNVPSDKPFTFRAASCCWVATRNDVSDWRALTYVDLGTRSDTREPNRPPNIGILPFLRVPENCPRTYKMITFDPDGDKVRCRYGKIHNEECSKCSQPSGFHLDQDSCTLQYNSASSDSEIYGFEMVVEDFPKQRITLNYSDGSLTSKFPAVKSTTTAATTTTRPTTSTTDQATTTTTARPPVKRRKRAAPTTTTATTTSAATTTTTAAPTTTTAAPTTTTAAPTTTTAAPTTSTAAPTTTTAAPTTTTAAPTTTTAAPTTTTAAPTTTTAAPTTSTAAPTTTTAAPTTTTAATTTTTAATTTSAATTTTTVATTTTSAATTTTTAAPITTTPWPLTTTPNQPSPLSKLPLQIAFLVDPPAPSCQPGLYIPLYLPPTPSNGAHVQAEVNKEMEIRVKAKTANSVIDNIIFSGPHNMTKTKNIQNEFVITWTPTSDHLGNHYVICFIVESKSGSRVYQSDMRCVVVEVTPQIVEANVICKQSTMRVEVEKSTFPGLQEDHLQLSDPTNVVCSLQKYSNSTHIIAMFPLHACGTQIEEVDKYLKFRNEITTVDNKTDLVTRKHLLEVKFYCQYPKQGNVTQAFTAHRNLTTVWEKGFGKFTYQFEFFPSVQFSTMINPNSYPLEYDLGNRIYMQIEATSSLSNTELFVESCRASPYDNPNYRPTYTIIDNGCDMDSTVRVHPPAHKRQFRFSMEAFKFIGLHDQVYISCSVLMCTAGDPNTRCSKGCLKPSQRYKRAAVSQSSPHFISQGPLQLKRSVRSASDWTESPVMNLNLNLVFIAGCLLAAVGMISGVAVYKARVSRVKYQPLPTYES